MPKRTNPKRGELLVSTDRYHVSRPTKAAEYFVHEEERKIEDIRTIKIIRATAQSFQTHDIPVYTKRLGERPSAHYIHPSLMKILEHGSGHSIEFDTYPHIDHHVSRLFLEYLIKPTSLECLANHSIDIMMDMFGNDDLLQILDEDEDNGGIDGAFLELLKDIGFYIEDGARSIEQLKVNYDVLSKIVPELKKDQYLYSEGAGTYFSTPIATKVFLIDE